jgi:hypothetical protein
MNKIIIVGYPDSGQDRIEGLLLRCGMKPALPTLRDKLAAPMVISSLCQDTGAPDISGPARPEDFKQYTPAPVWNNLVADLMLGNLEQDLWGWVDSRALPLLDYLKGLDPSITFVFVYQNPKSSMMKPGHGPDARAEDPASHGILDRWSAYHSALLHFYLRNKERSILLHGNAAESTMLHFIDLMGERMGKPLPNRAGWLDTGAGVKTGKAAQTKSQSADTLSARTVEEIIARDAESYIAELFLMRHSRSVEVYEEMQSVADIPHSKDTIVATSPDAAWKAFHKQRWLCARLMCTLEKERESHALEMERHRAYSRFGAEAQQLLMRELRDARENIFAPLVSAEVAENKASFTGAAERVKSQLSYRLGQVLIRQSKSLAGLVCMPSALRAEMENFRKSSADPTQPKPPPLHEYADADLAERVKKQLSYRLGSVMEDHSKSVFGWISMPFALLHQIVLFRKQRSTTDCNE